MNLTGRRDGSSRFGPGNQFANFGSIGGAWIFTNTAMLQKEMPWLSFGKLRASYGTVGNDQIGDYKFLDSYAAAPNGYQQQLSLQPTKLFNKEYSWEQFGKLEVALEFGLFKDRIYGSVAFYQNRSKNQLISYSLPSQTGFTNVLMNFPGEVENKGFEFELRGDVIRTETFKWTANWNLSLPKNKLLAYPGLDRSSFANAYVVGSSLGVQRGYQYLGVDPQTGIYTFVDQNGDGKYDTKDYINYGSSDPKFYGGLQNSISYKRISLDVLFQFVKQTGKNPGYSSAPLGSGANVAVTALDHWKKPGDMVSFAKPTQTFGSPLYTSYSLVMNSSAIQTDASFIRMKNIALSYSISDKMLNAIGVKTFNAYIEAQNLFTITNYPGADPEVQAPFVMPPLKTIAIGIRAGF